MLFLINQNLQFFVRLNQQSFQIVLEGFLLSLQKLQNMVYQVIQPFFCLIKSKFIYIQDQFYLLQAQ